ncbi:pro-Pol polyprotein [Trichonephila clavipes]|uniref:Pro-Pol polyprotein n=1 Tax=Trichonephila clavipes TaxID=2585209 RepID=A0A8X6W8Y6_TRICX|nr:pro-Pol polyprotein [Trichonephila clavipes]
MARPELPFQVVNMDLIGPIDPPSSKGHTYILCLVDQHTRWGEAMPVTSLSAKETCEVLLNIFSRTEIYLLLKRGGFVEKNSAASWVTMGRVRNRCLHLATGRTRDDIERRIWQRQRRKGRNGGGEGGEETGGREK